MTTSTAVSTETLSDEDRKLLEQAGEILDLLKKAEKLGWSLVLTPEQLRAFVVILENGHLIKPRKGNG